MPTKHPLLKRALRAAVAALFVFALIHSAQVTREATLEVQIADAATGKPTPVRVRLQDAQGNRPRARGAAPTSDSPIPIPKQAVGVMWGRQDRAEGYLLQPDGSFYVDGGFDLRLPPGSYTLAISKGNEYVAQTLALDLKPGQALRRQVRLARWIDMPSRGWFSSDDHIHLQRSPRDDAAILRWIAAEDIHVGNILEMGDFWATYFTQYAFGARGRYTEDGRLLSPGQEEPRTPEIGHTISLGGDALVRMQPDYYSFDKLFDKVHSLGGVTGFAHQAMSFYGYRGMVLNVLRGKIDFLELAQFCVKEGPLALDHYYHFLDLGFRLTALAGSDFPWCGRGPQYGFPEQFAQIGNARFYTYVEGDLTFERWMASLKAGHTFATTGPIVQLKVDGRLPGDTLEIPAGSKVRITAEAFGQKEQVPLAALEIVGHGQVLKRTEGQNAERLSAELDLPVDRGIWIAARCQAGKGQAAHTTPVYVTTGGQGFANPATAPRYLELSEKYLQELEQELAKPGPRQDSQTSHHKPQLERQIAEARQALKRLAAQAAR